MPPKWNAVNPKVQLKNDIIDWLSANKLGWEPSFAKQQGTAFVNVLSEALWYIDGNEKTFSDRSISIPSQLQHFQGYRKPEKHKKVDAESLSRGVLTNHSTSLMFLASNSYMKSQCWSNVKQAVC